MQKYFIFFLYVLTFFISKQSIASNPSNKISEIECANALTQKKVGAFNIEITKDEHEGTKLQQVLKQKKGNISEVLKAVDFGDLDKDDKLGYIHFARDHLFYTISFPVDGKMRNISLTIEKENIYDGSFEDTQVLQEIKDILGDLPIVALNFINNLVLTYENIPQGTPPVFHIHPTNNGSDKYDKYTVMVQINKNVEDGLNLLKSTLDKTLTMFFPADKEVLIDFNTGLPNAAVLDHVKYLIQLELGDIIAQHVVTPNRWHDAMLADDRDTGISKRYTQDDVVADIPETVWLYLETDGGIYYPNISKRHVHRFAILDEIMELGSSYRERVNNLNHDTNELLRDLGFTMDDFFEEIDIDNSEEQLRFPVMSQLSDSNTQSTIRDFLNSRDIDFIHYLITSWKTRVNNINLIKVLLNEINTIPRNRLLDPTSVENRLTREILKYVKHVWRDRPIFEFVIENIYFDTLSISEMEHNIHTLERANHVLMSPEETDYIVLEQALRQALEG